MPLKPSCNAFTHRWFTGQFYPEPLGANITWLSVLSVVFAAVYIVSQWNWCAIVMGRAYMPSEPSCSVSTHKWFIITVIITFMPMHFEGLMRCIQRVQCLSDRFVQSHFALQGFDFHPSQYPLRSCLESASGGGVQSAKCKSLDAIKAKLRRIYSQVICHHHHYIHDSKARGPL